MIHCQMKGDSLHFNLIIHCFVLEYPKVQKLYDRPNAKGLPCYFMVK